MSRSKTSISCTPENEYRILHVRVYRITTVRNKRRRGENKDRPIRQTYGFDPAATDSLQVPYPNI